MNLRAIQRKTVLLFSALNVLLLSPYNGNRDTAFVKAFDIGIPLTAIDTFYRTSPYASAFITCGVKASIADIVANSGKRKGSRKSMKQRLTVRNMYQGTSHLKTTNKRTIFTPRKRTSTSLQKENIQRNLAYILYGGFYQGIGQEFLYNEIFPSLFGEELNFGSVIRKIAFDQAVVAPLVTLPLMYVIKALIFRTSLKQSMATYVDDIKTRNLLKYFWMLWIPVKLLKFTVIPEHLRITFLAVVSFFWMIVFSSVTERKKLSST